MTEVSRSKMLKGAGWVSAATIAVNCLGILSTIILARLLLPVDFGLVAIATAIVGIIGVLTEFSLSKALIQHSDPTDDHYHTAWTMNVIRAVIVGALIAALGLPLSALYGDERLVEILWVLGFTTVIGGFVNPRLVVFQRELSFRQSFIIRCTSKIAGFCACISVAWLYQSYWALIVGAVATETAIMIMSYVLIPFRPRIALSKYRDLLSFSVWLTLAQSVQAINWRAMPLLYGYLLPASLLGQFSLGNKLVTTTIDQATSPIKSLLFPAFSRLQDNKARLRLGYIQSQGTICLITFPIAAGFAVLAEDIVRLVIGEKWLLAVPLMQLFAITRIIQSMQNLGPVAMASAETKRLFHRDLRAFFIRWPLVISGLYLGHRIGDGDAYAMLIGGMLGQIVTVIVNAYLNMRLIAKVSPVSVVDHWSFIWRPLVAICVMYAVVYWTDVAVHGVSGPLADASKIIFLVLLGALTYAMTLYVMWIIGGKGKTVESECAKIAKDLVAKAAQKMTPKEN